MKITKRKIHFLEIFVTFIIRSVRTKEVRDQIVH